MTWLTLMQIIREESGPDIAARIERRALLELQGVRLTVGARQTLTREAVDAVAPGRPAQAARALGVHPATVYRALRRAHNVR